jgi:hypothetical protein
MNASNSSNNLSGLSEFEHVDNFTDALGDENVFRCCELMTTLVRSKKWLEISHTLMAVSEALLKPENR